MSDQIANVDYRALLKNVLGSRVVAYNVGLAKLLNSSTAALLLSQFLYYDNKDEHTPGSPFSVTQEEIEDHTALSSKVQRTARKLLKEKRILTVVRKGVPARNHYTINYENMAALASGQYQMPLDRPNKIVPNGLSVPARSAPLVVPDRPVLSTNKELNKVLKKRKRARMKNAPFSVEIARMVFHRNPNKTLWATIEKQVDGQYLKWARICKRWLASGYNRSNFRGMLNVHKNGWTPKQNSFTTGRVQSNTPGYDQSVDVAQFKKERGMQ